LNAGLMAWYRKEPASDRRLLFRFRDRDAVGVLFGFEYATASG